MGNKRRRSRAWYESHPNNVYWRKRADKLWVILSARASPVLFADSPLATLITC